MIDTIAIMIPTDSFEVTDFTRFTPSAIGVLKEPYYPISQGCFSCIQNPTKKELEEGIYKPKLTITRRLIRGGFSTILKIEFSAPKLLFGNNFQELEDKDFEQIISKLHNVLNDMGVLLSKQSLIEADVIGIHYSKNIDLNGLSTSSTVIKWLKRLDVSKRLDAGDTDFRNEGQALRFHTNSYELVFYDKMKDLKVSKVSDKRSLEKDNTIQHSIFSIKELDILEYLRIELRLNKRKKIKDVLSKIGISNSMKLSDLFCKDIARKALSWFWEAFVAKSQHILVLSEQDPEFVLQKLLLQGIKKGKALEIMGFLSVVRDGGCRAFKNLMSSKDNVYQRLQKIIASLRFDETYLCGVFNHIGKTIKTMETIKIIKGENL